MNKFVRAILSTFVFVILIPFLYVGSVLVFCSRIAKAFIPGFIHGSLIYCDDFTAPGVILLIGLPILSGFLIYLFFWKNHRDDIKPNMSKEVSLKLDGFHKKFLLWRNITIISIVIDTILLFMVLYQKSNPVVPLVMIFFFIWVSLILTIIYYVKSRKRNAGGKE